MSALFTKEIKSAINRRAYTVSQDEIRRVVSAIQGRITLDVIRMIEEGTDESEILDAIALWQSTTQ